MYAVVGCGECGALWVVRGRPETTGCPRCGTRHAFERLRRFVRTDDEDRARQARAEMLADRSGYGDAIDEIGSFVELDDAADDAAVPEEEYLGAAGVDVDAVTAAGEDAARGRSPDARTHRDIVESALRDLDDPSEREVVDYARERDVPAEAASQLLERMVRAGEASENRGRYRLL